MSRYLIKTKEEYRVDTLGEVDEFQKELRADGTFILDSFSYETKTTKEKGVIVDEYQKVIVNKTFDDAKNPTGGVEAYLLGDGGIN